MIRSRKLSFLAVAIAGFFARRQAQVVAYLQEENRVLRDQIGPCRIRFTDAQRRRLARAGKAIGHRALEQIATLATPDTILRWHRQLVARKRRRASSKAGRPRVAVEDEQLVVRIAGENPGWGYLRIQGAVAELGLTFSAGTVRNILRRNDLDPAPRRKRSESWIQFLRTHFHSIAAMDFFTTEVWTTRGLATFYTLVVLDLGTRRLKIAGTTTNPDTAFMTGMARALVDPNDGFLRNKRHIIHDRDRIFAKAVDEILASDHRNVVRTPPRAPDCNAHCERVILSIRTELTDRMLFLGESSFRRALREYEAHYNTERPHQALGNRIPHRGSGTEPRQGSIKCRVRLGGLLRYYHRRAA